MTNIIIYSKDNCSYCRMAKDFFDARQIAYTEIRVDLDSEKLEEMLRLSQRRTVPQIVINDQFIGGYDDLVALSKSGKLNDLL
jgi:glutaredoxin 3